MQSQATSLPVKPESRRATSISDWAALCAQDATYLNDTVSFNGSFSFQAKSSDASVSNGTSSQHEHEAANFTCTSSSLISNSDWPSEVALAQHRNQQYSIYAMTNSSGSVVERYAYTAYGQPTFLDASGFTLPTSNFTIRYTYTAREWDHTVGLCFYRTRWSSNNCGRFCNRDLVGFEGGFNIYALYDVLMSVDPMGTTATFGPSGDWDPDCVIEISNVVQMAECEMAGVLWGSSIQNIACSTEPWLCCINAFPNSLILNASSSFSYDETTTCTRVIDEPPLEAGIGGFVRVVINFGKCGLRRIRGIKTVKGEVKIPGRKIIETTKTVTRRTGQGVKTIYQNCVKLCEKYESSKDPGKGGTAAQRTACYKYCAMKLACTALKAKCQAETDQVEKDVCFYIHDSICSGTKKRGYY